MSKSAQTWKDAVHFVLIRPEFLGNIGSIARALKNFGFSKLRLVEAPRNYKDAEARKMSVGAFDILKTSTVFTDLSEAISDIHFVIGTSCGTQRNYLIEPLDKALSLASLPSEQNKVAIVFGGEKDGLRSDELSLCHVIARIPTDPAFSSLNLAQSACIISYELARRYSANDMVNEVANVSFPLASDSDQLFGQVELLLQNIEFSRAYNKALLLSELRQFYNRAHPTKRESDLLHGVLRKFNQILVDRQE